VAAAQVRMATFSQHRADGLDLALTPQAYMLKCLPNPIYQPLNLP